MDTIIEVRDLSVGFYTPTGLLPAVDGVSFALQAGETLGIVGESGSGKSVTSLNIMRLLATPPGKILGGEVLFEGKNLLTATEREMQKIRGSQISMIFQEPMTSLNPVFQVGHQIAESVRIHQKLPRAAAMEKAIEMLELVGVPDPEKRVKEYPHQMSGGMRQRVMIAIALSCNPKLLIADEPTTALDVTIQAQILELMRDLRKKIGMTTILITHDLGVVANMVDRVMVMYAGRVMEIAPVKDLFEHPQHPYTEGLLDCIPRIDDKRKRLTTIRGVVPRLSDIGEGCRFASRCRWCQERCRKESPTLRGTAEHQSACHFTVDERKAMKEDGHE